MVAKVRNNQRLWLVLLIVICMGIILAGGLGYLSSLRVNLSEQAVQNVLAVTAQQQQAFDNFIAGDRERLHSYAGYFARNDSDDIGAIQRELEVFVEIDAFYTIINLDTGQFYNNKTEETYLMEGGDLEFYRALSGSGVRDPYVGLYTGNTMFGYYECFTFADGARGLIQKSYDCSKVSETFSLSFYNDQGFAYVVNHEGDILLRSVGMLGDRLYDNIFDVLAGHNGEQQKIDDFMQALNKQETGSMVFAGAEGDFVYSYVPMENAEEWYLVSIVRQDAITKEADEILRDSQMAVGFLTIVLTVCAILVMLIWRTHKDIQEKDWEIKYQEQLFDIFTTYLAENSDDIYMMIDAKEEHLEYISPNADRILGISTQDIISDLHPFSGAEHVTGEKVDFGKLSGLEPGLSLRAMKLEWTNPKTKEHKWFQMSAYGALVQDERKIIVYISDRTQERKVQDTLSEALRIAQVANKAKSTFLSSVSHDIRTPMNAIIGFTALLREEADNPDLVREYTQRIDAASQHLLGLVNDVLDMNKIESGSATLKLVEMNLADIIDEINVIIQPQTKAKGQNFEILSSSITHENLKADKLRINQILINLLSNAVKYTPEGGEIRMLLEELPQVVDNYSRIRFTISDNGMGMSEEYQKIIFDPFTWENSEIIRQTQGTGLGMAITKRLVDLMGGTIRVQSRLGEGSVFTVELELYIQEREDDPGFWEKHHVKRMIVADDEEEVCLNIVKAMKKTGVITDYSTTGEAAIRMVQEAREEGRPYDLILLDWKMPNLNGLETARIIRKDYPEKIPILLFTAYDWEEIEQEAVKIGVDYFLPKPFFMSTFKEVIRRVMGNLKKAAAENNSTVVKGKHILVVDDIEANQIILVKILSTLGAVCDVAVNGQEAIDKFEASQPGTYDLILMDVQMPVVDGYAATRAIRASSHSCAGTVPIIAMTANAFVDDVRDAIESGMDAHIAKPVQLDKLKSTIQQVFDSRKQ